MLSNACQYYLKKKKKISREFVFMRAASQTYSPWDRHTYLSEGYIQAHNSTPVPAEDIGG